MTTIDSIEELEAIYGLPQKLSLDKVADHITSDYRKVIEASPFCALATSGPEGLDCSPRGDELELMRIQDERTLLLPDRRGNNRADTLRNIVVDPRIALLFLIPGSGMTLRMNGRAVLRKDAELLETFAVKNKPPRCVIEITVQEIYFQCARAILRADLWNSEKHIDPKSLPSAGDILAAQTQGSEGGKDYDEAWPARAKKTMW